MVHKSGEGRLVLPRESFTRSQLAAIIDSSIHRFIGSGGWAGWLAGLGWAGLAGWLGCAGLGWLAISTIFMDFRGFHEISWISGARGSQPLPTVAAEMLPLKKPLLDPSWLLFH